MILVIGNSTAYEVAAFNEVRLAVERRGDTCVLFKQDKCLEGEHLRFRIRANQPLFEAIIDGVPYDLDSFSGIWYLKPLLPKAIRLFEPIEYRQLLQRQFYELREAIWTIFRSKRSLNDPWACRMAENKIVQLKAAAAVGFRVPETLITSDPDSVRAFYAEHPEGIVVKLLASVPLNDKVIYTNRVGEKEILEVERVRMSPSIFQEEIRKAHEVRITVVGNNIFAARIHSQDDPETALDWRRKPRLNDTSVTMSACELSNETILRIRAFMERMRLRFGCIDMIITPNGDEVFLEINPNGQWYFVQLKTEMQIAEAIADLLY